MRAVQADRTPHLSVLPYVQAVVLFAAYSLGYPWFASRLGVLLPDRPGSWLIIEVSALGLVGLLVTLFDWRGLAGRGLSARDFLAAGRRCNDGLPAAFLALALLGALALALRLIDPSFDDQELSLRNVTTPGAVGELLAVLPFGVAAEELIFRSCQRRLRMLVRPAPAVVAVGLGFAAYHWVPGSVVDRHEIETLLTTLAGGLVLAAAYEKTASVTLLIAVHLAYDDLAIAQAWLNVQGATIAETGLFLAWIGAASALAWRLRRPSRTAAGSRGGPAEVRPPDRAADRAVAWIASVAFGCGLPLVLAWIRIRQGF